MIKQKIDIVEVGMDEIIPEQDNPRKIGSEAFAALQKSVEQFGYVSLIVVSKNTKKILGGHQRYKVLKSKGVQRIRVLMVDLPEQEEMALNVTLNNPQIMGSFTEDVMKKLEVVKNADPSLFASLRLDEVEKQDGVLREIDLPEDGQPEIDENIETKFRCGGCGYEY